MSADTTKGPQPTAHITSTPGHRHPLNLESAPTSNSENLSSLILLFSSTGPSAEGPNAMLNEPRATPLR